MQNKTLKIDELGNLIFDKEQFQQVCIWEGTIVPEGDIEKFTNWFKQTFGADILFLESIQTKPDFINGIEVMNTGGRTDIFFAVNMKTAPGTFPTHRLEYGIRWIEDATSEVNEYFKNPVYPERVLQYKTW